MQTETMLWMGFAIGWFFGCMFMWVVHRVWANAYAAGLEDE